ncbi:MAG: Gfo/Idh/MocA family oxidoreductase [Candidatus Sumerlaeia bacterium]|nr:Gfo/Idh/MocA family oxidoreductase [Candidatus Sumerlaeia bacterium]
MKSVQNMTRRNFVKSAALAGAVTGWTARSWSQVMGSNSDIFIAVVGFGGRGKDHIGSFSQMKGVRLAALCDADNDILQGQLKRHEGVQGYQDIRKLLENKDIDAISIATPNHWHALGAIWAIQAGKDVYVEKPVSHNVSEGRRIVEFARKYNKIVQTGTQSRSSITGIKQAVEWVKAGNLGKIKISRGLCYKRRDSIGKVDGPQPIPPGVDYDLWCGPALKLPLMRKRLHYDWHWVWNTGNGDLGNQGIHEMDVARWFLGVNELSSAVLSVGGRVGYVDDGETPNTMIIYHEFAGAPLLFEVRGLPSKKGANNMDQYKGASIGIVIECEGGHVTIPSYTAAAAYDKNGKKIQEWKGAEDHYANFIKACRSRKIEDLNADILEGHLSSALCHTGNVSYLLGKKATKEEILAAIKSTPGMEDMFGRMLEHLKLNEVDIAKEQLTLGMPLKMDPKTERFIGNDKANELLTRPYRPGFVVPDKA